MGYYRDVLGAVSEEVVLALRDAVSRSSVDDFWSIWSRSAEEGLFRAYSLSGGPTVAVLPFLAEVCYGFVAGVWEAELLAAGVLAGCIWLAVVMRLMFIVLSILLILLFSCVTFVDVLSLLRMFLRVSRVASLRYWGAVCRHGPGPISSLHP